MINFPSSPTLNQTYAFGQKTWVWNGYAWDLQLANADSVIVLTQTIYNQANASFIHANSAFDAANNALDTWVRGQANAAFDHANSAFISANNEAGVNVTQNTNIQLAYNHANAAFEQANTGGASSDQYARDTANASFIHANAAFDAANSSSGITFTSSATPPSSPNAGDQWYRTSNDILYEYINDGTSLYWVDITSSAVASQPTSINLTSEDVLNPFLLAGM